jgi:hypothetical protein
MTKLPRDKIFPRFIDFGTLEVGEEETYVHSSTTTSNFIEIPLVI